MAHITTSELDDIARLGLNDLRECFSTSPPQGAMDRAELTLKILRQGTSRMSGENNRIATALKVARAAGLAPEDQRPLWTQIIHASAGAIAEPPSPSAEAARPTQTPRTRS